MTETLLRNAFTVVTMDDFGTALRDADIFLRDAEITELGQGLATSGTSLDCCGWAVTPGLFNINRLLFSSLIRAVPGARDAALFGWLQTLYRI